MPTRSPGGGFTTGPAGTGFFTARRVAGFFAFGGARLAGAFFTAFFFAGAFFAFAFALVLLFAFFFVAMVSSFLKVECRKCRSALREPQRRPHIVNRKFSGIASAAPRVAGGHIPGNRGPCSAP